MKKKTFMHLGFLINFCDEIFERNITHYLIMPIPKDQGDVFVVFISLHC